MNASELTKKDPKGRYVVDLPTALPKWAEFIAGVLDGESVELAPELRDLHADAIGLGTEAFKLATKPENQVASDLRPLREQALDVTGKWFSIQFRLDIKE